MKRETVVENSKKDATYYVIPQLSKVIPYHGGHYTASKLLSKAGLHNILAEDLLTCSERQRQLFFPHFESVWIEREITYIPKRSNNITLLSDLQVQCRAIAKEW